MCSSRHRDLGLYRRIWEQVRPHRLSILAFFSLSLAATPILLLNPLPLKIVVDSVLGDAKLPPFVSVLVPQSLEESRSGLLALAIALLGLCVLLTQAQKLASTMLHASIGERLNLEFRARVFRHAQRLSFAHHDRRGTADSTYRVLWDATAIRHLALDGVLPFVTAVVTVGAMLVVVLRIDWQLALIALTIVPALYVVVRFYRRRLREQWSGVKALESNALSTVQEVLGSLRVVRAFGQEEREGERFERQADDGLRARLRASHAAGAFSLLVASTTTAGTAAVLFVGVRHVQSDALTLGNLLVVMAYLAELYAPIQSIAKNVGGLQAHLASAERAFALLDEDPDVAERPDARPLGRAGGEVELRDVTFAYDGGPAVLSHVCFHIRPGMRVGIAGRTGAGKTTLIGLLSRFHDPSIGQVLLDGRDLRDWRLEDLRRQLAFVLQDPGLFSTTVAENIAYGRPGASENEIVAAARAASAHDFIVRLGDGYGTQVGERGHELSGGERQRIAIARAFLRDAPILVMDEPTSAVDRGTEAEIVEALDRLMAGRTTFLVSHRLDLLGTCDLLLVLEGGRIETLTGDVAAVVDRMRRVGLQWTR